MRVEDGVTLDGLRLPMLRALPVIEEVCYEVLGRELIVTSGVRPKNEASLHHGLAIDGRINDVSQKMRFVFLGRVRFQLALLDTGYETIIHDSGEGLHFHTEFDPS